MPHLGHVHLKVSDVNRSVAFYTDVLELSVTERHGRYAFLSFGEHHHDVALQGVGPDAPGQSAGVGLYHAAFEVADDDELAALHEQVTDRGVDVAPVDHGISRALYFDDPDGNGLEAYVDTRDSEGEEWAGENEPFDPSVPPR